MKEPFYWIARLGVYKSVEYGYIAGSYESTSEMGLQAVNRKSKTTYLTVMRFSKSWLD